MLFFLGHSNVGPVAGKRPHYFKSVANYIHLNAARARLPGVGKRMVNFASLVNEHTCRSSRVDLDPGVRSRPAFSAAWKVLHSNNFQKSTLSAVPSPTASLRCMNATAPEPAQNPRIEGGHSAVCC
jgi:hypothetical protein